MGKSQPFHYPEAGGTYFGRVLSTAYSKGTLWIAVQMEKEKKNTITVIRKKGEESSSAVLNSKGFCHQPCIVPKDDDDIVVIWNEVDKNTWKLRCASLSETSDKFQNIETISSSKKLYLPPSAIYFKNELWVSWPGIGDKSIRINIAKKSNNGWQILDPVSKEGIDSFRPSLASNRNEIFLAWDQYNTGRYEVASAYFDGSKWDKIKTLSQDNERWFCPKVIASDSGTAYITWVVLKEVSDQLGIIDHFPFAMVARFKNNRLEYMLDRNNPIDSRIIADFREGLLATKSYMGYHGLRRNPFLTISENGELWCLWEVRIELEKSPISGHLVGRKLKDDNTWGSPRILHSHRYGYSVPGYFSGDRIPATFFKFEEEGTDIIGSDFINLDNSKLYQIDNSKWKRWKSVSIEPQNKSRKKIKTGNKEYSLFWADTHCHSNFSPDAEGEVDELIHFARDTAGIDAVCVIDNDYYLHKALTEAEWKIHQEFSTHFTKEGKFVVFPGWEYTYHRKDLNPVHNHRCILYPRAGGKIFRRIDRDTNSDEKLFKKLKGTNVMCYPHHCSYKIIDPELDRNVEVCSSWRVCIEEADFTVKILQSGEKLGFIGSSDSHRAVPGLGGALTGLFAEKLTPEGLFEAYKNRRIIATQGFFIFIDFRAGGTFIGGESEISGYPEIEASIEAPREMEFVEVLRDGRSIYKETTHDRKFDFHFKDKNSKRGEHFYFLRVKLIGDPSFNIDPAENSLKPHSPDSEYPHNLARARGVFAWTSPVWLKIR